MILTNIAKFNFYLQEIKILFDGSDFHILSTQFYFYNLIYFLLVFFKLINVLKNKILNMHLIKIALTCEKLLFFNYIVAHPSIM